MNTSHGEPTATEPAPASAPEAASPERNDPAERVADRHDLSDLLEQLHDDYDLEADSAPVPTEAPLTDPRDLERPVTETIVIESTGGLEYRPVFASFGSRLKGAVIDGLVLSLAMVPGGFVLLQTSGGTYTLLGMLLLVVGFVVATVSYARSVSRTGQWFGNRIANTKVVSATNGAHLDAGHAGARFAGRHLVSVIFLFGFIVGLTDSQRRTFHDRLAGSIVVGRPRATWSAGDDDA